MLSGRRFSKFGVLLKWSLQILWTHFMKNPNLFRRTKEMMSKGIIHINDMLSHTGHTLGYYDFMEKHNIQLNFVDFYSLTHAIPRHWLMLVPTSARVYRSNVGMVFLKILSTNIGLNQLLKYWGLAPPGEWNVLSTLNNIQIAFAKIPFQDIFIT